MSFISQIEDSLETSSLNEEEEELVAQNRALLVELRQNNTRHQNNENFSSSFMMLQNNLLQPETMYGQQRVDNISSTSGQCQEVVAGSSFQSITTEFLPTLIEEVRMYRCLWDTSCRAFKESQKKEEAWNRVSERLNVSGMLSSKIIFLCAMQCIMSPCPRISYPKKAFLINNFS